MILETNGDSFSLIFKGATQLHPNPTHPMHFLQEMLCGCRTRSCKPAYRGMNRKTLSINKRMS